MGRHSSGNVMSKKQQFSPTRIAFTLEEVANITGLSQWDLKVEHDRGRLEFVNDGQRTLLHIGELRRYLAQHPRYQALQMVLFDLKEDRKPKARKSRKT
jgi:hypothetical protein